MRDKFTDQQIYKKILKLIRECRREGIQRAWLMRQISHYANAEALNKIITTLKEANLIKVETIRYAGKKREVAYGEHYTIRRREPQRREKDVRDFARAPN